MTEKNEPTCKVISATDSYHGKQGLDYIGGVTAESVGSQAISMLRLTIPPLGKAKAHRHDAHETAIYVISGESITWYGEGLSQQLTVRAGEFLYIPAGVPHLPMNPSETEPCVAIIARTDPNEQESVVLMPELDEKATGA